MHGSTPFTLVAVLAVLAAGVSGCKSEPDPATFDSRDATPVRQTADVSVALPPVKVERPGKTQERVSRTGPHTRRHLADSAPPREARTDRTTPPPTRDPATPTASTGTDDGDATGTSAGGPRVAAAERASTTGGYRADASGGVTASDSHSNGLAKDAGVLDADEHEAVEAQDADAPADSGPRRPKRLVLGGRSDDGDPPPEEDPDLIRHGVILEVPDAAPLPDVPVTAGDDVERRQRVLRQLVGRWKQVEGGNAADFVEGGYSTRTLRFEERGMLTITQDYGDGSISLSRRVDYLITATHRLTLGEKKQPDSPIDVVRTIPQASGDDIRITPATHVLPHRGAMAVTEGKLKLYGKTYVKAEPES